MIDIALTGIEVTEKAFLKVRLSEPATAVVDMKSLYSALKATGHIPTAVTQSIMTIPPQARILLVALILNDPLASRMIDINSITDALNTYYHELGLSAVSSEDVVPLVDQLIHHDLMNNGDTSFGRIPNLWDVSEFDAI